MRPTLSLNWGVFPTILYLFSACELAIKKAQPSQPVPGPLSSLLLYSRF